MEERYVRCRRCHGVFESGVANCPRCGAEYVAIEEPLPSSEGSYEEKYKGTEFVPPVEVPQVAPRQQGSRYGLMLGGGAVLTLAALVVAMLFMSGVIGAPAPTEDWDIVYPVTPKPSPSPTMPPIVDDALRVIADPNFNGHVSIRSTVTVAAAANNGKAVAHTVAVEADMADGQTVGTLQINVPSEFRLVDGVYYSRALPNGTWSVKSSIPPFLLLSPLFAITDTKQIIYGGATSAHGAAHLIGSTDWYRPDPLKITGIDMTSYTVKVDHWTLALYLDSDGNPVYAEFRAWKDAADGTHLVNIVTNYTFSAVGKVAPGGTPGSSSAK
jgi:hypothetical protein